MVDQVWDLTTWQSIMLGEVWWSWEAHSQSLREERLHRRGLGPGVTRRLTKSNKWGPERSYWLTTGAQSYLDRTPCLMQRWGHCSKIKLWLTAGNYPQWEVMDSEGFQGRPQMGSLIQMEWLWMESIVEINRILQLWKTDHSRVQLQALVRQVLYHSLLFVGKY